MRTVLPFHSAATQQRGVIAVAPRERDATGQAIGYVKGATARELPTGDAMMDAVWNHPGNDRMHMPESVAITRYLSAQGVDVRDLIDEFLQGQTVGQTTVERWLTNTGLRPLFSPVVEDGLRMGMNRIASSWRNLVAREIPVSSPSYEYYEFDNGSGTSYDQTGREEFRLLRVAEGAPVPVARIKVSGRAVHLYQKGRGIEWTDQSKAAPMDLAALWFAQVGLDIGWGFHDEVIDVLLNGIFPDGHDDAPTVGTAVPGEMTDADLYTAQATHQILYGRSPDALVVNIARSVALQTLENGAGQRVFPNGVQAAGLPPIVISERIPNNKAVFVDTAFAVIRLVLKEFGTEFDRVPQNAIEGSYGRTTDRFISFMPDARMILTA